jgi:hypothetical protein
MFRAACAKDTMAVCLFPKTLGQAAALTCQKFPSSVIPDASL